ncbi:MAG TPA: class I SAM-dependent methyltransferase [Thermoanaerobaculia bacterium]|nr:class I SAM-dependent methyltransferase [Thermoanaerobaculia bacterium]
MSTLDEWNRRYRAQDAIHDDPAPLLVQAAAGLPPGSALDLACGSGRNAAWLARQGWNVVAIDGAEEAIRLVRAHELPIDARVMDLETGAPLPFPDATFDLVAILYYLHRPLYAEASRVLKPGGVIVSAIRMRGIDRRYCVSEGELRGGFRGWEVVWEGEGEIAEIVVRKPECRMQNAE